VRHAKDIDEVLGARATVALKAATQLQGRFGHWASRTAAAGPGASALLRGARAEITARAGSLLVANGAYPEPAILRAASALLSRNTTPAGRAVVLGYAMTSLRAGLVLRAAWTAAREDAHDVSITGGASPDVAISCGVETDGRLLARCAPPKRRRLYSLLLHPLLKASREDLPPTSRGTRLQHQRRRPRTPAPRRLAAPLRMRRFPRPPRPPQASPPPPRGQQVRASHPPTIEGSGADKHTPPASRRQLTPECHHHHAPRDLSSERRGRHFLRRGDPRFPAFGWMGCGAASGDGCGGGRGTGTKPHARRRGQRSQGGYGAVAVETHWVGGRGATCRFGVR